MHLLAISIHSHRKPPSTKMSAAQLNSHLSPPRLVANVPLVLPLQSRFPPSFDYGQYRARAKSRGQVGQHAGASDDPFCPTATILPSP